MVRINLLSGKKRKTKPLPRFILYGVILFALAVTVILYFNYFLKGKIASLTLQENRNQQTIEALRSKIAEVKKYERLNKKFNERKQIIEQLRQNQALPVMVLDEISARLTGGVWLTGLNFMQNGIKMSGLGYTNDNVVAFVQNLKGSPLFSGVYLDGTTKTADEGATVYQFSLTMQVKGMEQETEQGNAKGKAKVKT